MNDGSPRQGWFKFSKAAGASNWLWLSGAVIVLDQISKRWIVDNLELYEQIFLHRFLDITRLHNTGAAFSFLSQAGGWQRWFFMALGAVVSGVVMVWLRRLPARGEGWLASALALIVGGALGNVIDRMVYGHVIDFIHVHYERWYFPAFNVADSAISVGAVIYIISIYTSRESG